MMQIVSAVFNIRCHGGNCEVICFVVHCDMNTLSRHTYKHFKSFLVSTNIERQSELVGWIVKCREQVINNGRDKVEHPIQFLFGVRIDSQTV